MINLFAQEIMASLDRYQEIKLKDIYQSGSEKSVIDLLIAEMIQAKYITLDFDDNGDEIVKEYKGDKKADIISKKSNAIFIDSTNIEILNECKYRDGKITFRNGVLYFFGRFGEIVFRTSMLEYYEINDDLLIFKTMNSVYKFKMLKDIKVDDSILASQEKINKVKSLNI